MPPNMSLLYNHETQEAGSWPSGQQVLDSFPQALQLSGVSALGRHQCHNQRQTANITERLLWETGPG